MLQDDNAGLQDDGAFWILDSPSKMPVSQEPKERVSPNLMGVITFQWH